MKNGKFIIALIMSLLMSSFAYADDAKVVFSADFNEGCNAENWNTFDANGDGLTWSVNSQLNGYIYNGMTSLQTAEDWLFTPAFEVEAGKYYILTYTVAQRGAYEADNMTIYMGKSSDVSAMTIPVIDDVMDMQGGMRTRRCRLYVAESASYVLGLKLVSSAGNGVVSLKDISVAESQACTPQAVPAMVANMDIDAQMVKLKWINPKKDLDDVYVSDKMDILVYEDEELVGTIEGVTPGAEQAYNYNPANFSGKHTVSVVVRVNGLESERVSKVLDFDDAKGSLVPVYTFPLKTKSDFAEWNVTNADNDSYKWEFYSGAVYISAINRTVDDWFITPGYELAPGQRYVLTYELKSSRDYPVTLDVTMGTEQSSTAQSAILTSYSDLCQNGFATFQTPQFEVAETTTYYFGFHAMYVGNSLDLRNVTINTIDGAGEVQEEELEYVEPVEEIFPDNINGDLNVEQPYHQRLSSEGVELYGVFTNSLLDKYTLAQPGIYHMQPGYDEYYTNLSEPELIINLGGGATYHDGKIYCNEYDASSNIQAEFPVWKVLDAHSYQVLAESTLKDNCENTTISMAYDATTDKIYGLVKDYIDTYLVEIDPMTGAMTRMRNGERLDYKHRYLAIGCNANGELYCVYMTEDNVDGQQIQYLARINKATGAVATIGEITALNMMPDDMFVNMKMRQSLFFNNQNGKLYWFFCSSSSALGGQYGAIFELNTLNANAVLQTWNADVLAISGAFFVEPNVQAPGIVTDVEYVPESEGALAGTLSFKLPETTYDGKPLTTKLSYKVLRDYDRNEVFAGEGMPGEAVSHRYEASEGIYDLWLIANNEYGTGVEKAYTILVGYDQPAAPENLVLSEKDWTTTVLTWDAPSTGLHGEPYDKSKLTYNIYDQNSQLVASGLTETCYEEQHGDEMQRYVYAVYSCYDGQPIKGAMSNDIVVGKPLTPPYGGVFTQWSDMYNYYTILDVNKDGYTWLFDGTTGAAFYPYNYQLTADDWMISPSIQYYEGDVYTLRFSAFSTDPDYLESLLVTFGNGKTPEAQSAILMDMPELPAIGDDDIVNVYSTDIVVPASGVYYFGFKAYSKPWQDYLYLYNVTLEKTIDGAVHGVQSFSRDFDAYYYNGGISVINPNAADITIYNINGVQVHQSSQTEYNVELTPGVYVVRSARSVVKVVVR